MSYVDVDVDIEAKHKRNEELYIEGSISKERFLEYKTSLESKKTEQWNWYGKRVGNS